MAEEWGIPPIESDVTDLCSREYAWSGECCNVRHLPPNPSAFSKRVTCERYPLDSKLTASTPAAIPLRPPPMIARVLFIETKINDLEYIDIYFHARHVLDVGNLRPSLSNTEPHESSRSQCPSPALLNRIKKSKCTNLMCRSRVYHYCRKVSVSVVHNTQYQRHTPPACRLGDRASNLLVFQARQIGMKGDMRIPCHLFGPYSVVIITSLLPSLPLQSQAAPPQRMPPTTAATGRPSRPLAGQDMLAGFG